MNEKENLMKLPYSEPDPAGSERARIAKNIRDLATEISRLQPQALSKSNHEESDHPNLYPANFTKGLLHNKWGLLQHPQDYHNLVEAINSADRTLFEKHVISAKMHDVRYYCTRKNPVKMTDKSCPNCGDGKNTKEFKWRAWESPRAGHVYELEGPDAGAVGMPPAPRVGSSELSAEMAEVYSLALLRDVPFTTICDGGSEQLCKEHYKTGKSILSSSQIVDLLNKMPFYSGKNRSSSTPCNSDSISGLNRFEANRRYARTLSHDGGLTTENVFRGSTAGAHEGPYLSQFMLIGVNSRTGAGGGASSFPGISSTFDLQDGFITYGTLSIDQRTITHKNCLDYMTDWCSWLDVQNGANTKGIDLFEEKRRFITTPRDLATYVHYDELYEAYLNACLILLSTGAKHSKGFPEPSVSGNRDAFATFGGPHILSLLTEVSSRCLKAVRRQKFNYHRRARPEAMGGRFTLTCLGEGHLLDCAEDAFQKSFDEIPKKLKDAIIQHNKEQNAMSAKALECEASKCKTVTPNTFDKCNLLLPMAFPEGSPMHPAYGAGHATVAGGCITMLKAFFEMFEDNDSNIERKLLDSNCKPICFVPNSDGSKLVKDKKFKGALTIQGELDKLAANISIGRNMAGVHYYSDYYDSLRMGERVAVGILMQQAPTYGDYMETTFKSFDGDMITISGEAGSCPSMSIIDKDGSPVKPNDWWLRHVVGEEFIEDI
jgi:hypothetical protein